jgi:hypothetical protein
MPKKSRATALPQILHLRGQRVVLDADLAALYGVATKRLNEAVRRNAKRFPDDFCFLLSSEEAASLRSQIATSKPGRGGQRYLPRVFTEHGCLMAANILSSSRAVPMSIYLVRAFVRMRDEIMADVTILKRLAEIDRRLIEHDVVLREVVERLQPLLDAPAEEEKPQRKIGFHQGNR